MSKMQGPCVQPINIYILKFHVFITYWLALKSLHWQRRSNKAQQVTGATKTVTHPKWLIYHTLPQSQEVRAMLMASTASKPILRYYFVPHIWHMWENTHMLVLSHTLPSSDWLPWCAHSRCKRHVRRGCRCRPSPWPAASLAPSASGVADLKISCTEG